MEESIDEEAKEIAERIIMRELMRHRSERCCEIEHPGKAIWVRGIGELAWAIDSCRVVFVFFRSPTCPYCNAMEPLIDEAARQLSGKALFVKVDVAMTPEAAAAARVMATPTLVALVRGKELDRIVGMPPIEYLEDFILRALEAGGCAA